MDPYLFQGVVLPERAQLSLQFHLTFVHVGSGIVGTARVSIVLNQIAVWIDSEHEWNLFDLRNVVKTLLQNQLALIGYLKGYAYDFEVTRVLNQSRQIDYVFGIDVPCIAERGNSVDLHDALTALRGKTTGEGGLLLNRCFGDLSSALKNADDTGFYCYRAIESLRHHCAARYDMSGAEKSKQWERFREVAGCSEDSLRAIKEAADPLRHGESSAASSDARMATLTLTWDVVDSYLNKI